MEYALYEYFRGVAGIKKNGNKKKNYLLIRVEKSCHRQDMMWCALVSNVAFAERRLRRRSGARGVCQINNATADRECEGRERGNHLHVVAV